MKIIWCYTYILLKGKIVLFGPTNNNSTYITCNINVSLYIDRIIKKQQAQEYAMTFTITVKVIAYSYASATIQQINLKYIHFIHVS